MRDLYQEINDVVVALAAAGHAEVAAQVTDMMAAGATGTEILMGVRHVLSQFLPTTESLELTAAVGEVLTHITQALDP
ncbi:MAG: hypothetical protein Q4D96_12600 [Propionibacteriaceae bacterium]|nr:hypothetical protein [Propionibacteriaceae bacterium]